MNVLWLSQRLQRCSDVVHLVDVKVQQIEGLDCDTGLSPSSLHCALNSPSKDLAGQRPAPLYVLLTPGDIALALTRNVLPVFIVRSSCQ